MSVFLQCHIRNTVKNYFVRSPKLRRKVSEKFIRRFCMTETKKFVPFLDLVEARRDEAKRSVLVQVQSAQSFKELYSYCSSIGVVKQMLHYVVGVEPMNFIVVEFGSTEDVQNILKGSSYLNDSQIIPVHSQFLWFRASNRKLPKLKQVPDAKLNLENGNNILNSLEVIKLLKNCDSVSNQMQVLYDSTKLNDLGTRLRFLTASQVENSIKGMFPTAAAYPFGSSVNGFGKMGCDLDLVLRLNDEKYSDDARLMFHCKGLVGSERSASQRNMEAIGDLLQLFLPGCSQVRRILQARVPIIKYYQQLTDVECDLSMSNMSGIHMSDFLYIMGALDKRVRPLVFTVRKWASETGLTNCSPGRWITNFSLTLLVLAFLQNSPAILPSLNSLVKLADKKDHYITEDGINCTFLRDVNKLNRKCENDDSLEDLLIKFFEFYCQFDFAAKAVCLNEPVAITKPEHCAMYIINPLERGLNVSKNVGFEEFERFKSAARNAAWLLESKEEHKSENWGILSIFEHKTQPKRLLNFTFQSKQSRMVEVSTLFEETEPPIEFKNESVKKQVESIKNETRDKINELKKINR